jgi:F-type H+-transporting ATPase subunit b
MEIVHQLAALFLQALPTAIVVVLFYFFLRWAFFQPIQNAMAERSKRIDGARAEAAEIERAAQRDLDSHNQGLKNARAEIYAEQEQARQAALVERAKLLKALRDRVRDEVAATKKGIENELAAARAEVESQAPALAQEIARMILKKPSPSREGATQ